MPKDATTGAVGRFGGEPAPAESGQRGERLWRRWARWGLSGLTHVARLAHVDGVEGGAGLVEATALRGARNEAARARLMRVSAVAALVLPAALLVLCGFARRWVGDDGFINVRVAQHLLDGDGLVFNVGERTEAITSPAWVAVLAVAGGLGLRIDDAAWSLSLILAASGLVWSGWASTALRAAVGRRSWSVPLGLLCYACLPPAWDYATSGLENGLGLAFLGGSYWAVARAIGTQHAGRRRMCSAALLLGFAPLVRPDYVLLSAPLILLLAWCAPGRGLRVGVVAAAMAPGAFYQVFRMGYFASLVPNTALAKEAFHARWEQGWHYFANGIGLYWVAVPVLCLLASLCLERTPSERGSRVFAAALVASGAIHLLYVVRVGGDFMHGRMLLPGLFAVFSAAPVVTFDAAPSRSADWAKGLLCAVAWGWCLICGCRLRVDMANEFGIGDERGWYARRAEYENPTRIEHYARMPFYRMARRIQKRLARRCEGQAGGEACPPVLVTNAEDGSVRDHPGSALLPLQDEKMIEGIDAVVAFRPLGISSGVLGPHVNLVDYFGLADPVASRLSLAKRGRPGHEKAFNTLWLSGKYAAAGSTTDARVHAARRALDCGLLHELRHATTDPLDLSRFIRNIRQAFALHALRVPSDPRAARRQFCEKSG